MSTHQAEVIEVKMLPHGNADSLSIVKISGYTIVVRTADWHDGQLAVYVEPDYIVPADRPEFSFLAQTHKIVDGGYRVRVKRLRGVMSMGLLIPAPSGSKVGDNLLDELGIKRYVPAEPMSTGGDNVSPPAGIRYVYDVESAYRYKHLFTDGEEIVATEKIHGANARYCYHDGKMYCGSRTGWKLESANNIWWKSLTPELRKFCEDNQDITVYGEVYGQVQDLKYGCKGAEFITFDLLRKGIYVDYDEARQLGASLPWVPDLYRGPWDVDNVFALADGDSHLSSVKQIREGIVVKPIHERMCDEIGRVQLKIVSNKYLERV